MIACSPSVQRKVTEMPLCTELSVVNANETEGEISLLKCKRWTCDICNPDNRWKVMQRAKYGKPNVFMTLTVPPHKYADKDEAARDMRRGLVLLRRRIAKKWNIENIPFLVVFEAHKSGWPHMHLLLRAKFMPQQILKAMWKDIMGAGSVDLRFIKDTGRVLAYIVKYIGKDLGKFEGCKRWWRSQNYDLGEDEYEKPHLFGDRIFVTNFNYEQLAQQMRVEGYHIKQKGNWRFYFRLPDEGLRGGLPPAKFEAHRW